MNVKYLGIFILLIFVLSLNSISAADSDDGIDEPSLLNAGIEEDALSSPVCGDGSEPLEDALQASESGDESLLEADEEGVSLGNVNSGVDNQQSSDEGSKDLSIQVISNNPNAKVGDRISFDVIVKNIGSVDLTGAYVLLLDHDGLTFDSYAGDKWDKINDKIEFNETLKAGQTEVLTIFFIADDVGVLNFGAAVGAVDADNDRAFNQTRISDGADEDETSINNSTTEIVGDSGNHASYGVDVSEHATGNPILLSLLSLMFLPIRRFL